MPARRLHILSTSRQAPPLQAFTRAAQAVHRSLSTSCLLLLLAAGCRQASRDDEAAGAAGKPFRVALLTSGSIADQAWNAGAYHGLLRIRDSLGARISHIQTTTPAEFEENFRQYGAQGYDLVIGHGFEYQDAALRVGPAYPHTDYVVTSGTAVRQPNVASIEFGFEDASYLAGIVAGYLTRTNVIANIGGQAIPPVSRSFASFAAGARSVNPRVKVLTSYIGNWDDASAGKEQALAQIARGADVIFQNADAAGLGVFQAARESPHVYVFGSNSNQNDIAPQVTPASVVIDLPHALLLVAREVKSGRFHARLIRLGAREDVVRLEMNPALAAAIPAAATAAVDSVHRLIVTGRFDPRALVAPSTTAP